MQAQQDAGGDHLARRGDEGDAIGSELAPVLLVDDTIVAVHDDQPAPLRPRSSTKPWTIGPIAEKSSSPAATVGAVVGWSVVAGPSVGGAVVAGTDDAVADVVAAATDEVAVAALERSRCGVVVVAARRPRAAPGRRSPACPVAGSSVGRSISRHSPPTVPAATFGRSGGAYDGFVPRHGAVVRHGPIDGRFGLILPAPDEEAGAHGDRSGAAPPRRAPGAAVPSDGEAHPCPRRRRRS